MRVHSASIIMRVRVSAVEDRVHLREQCGHSRAAASAGFAIPLARLRLSRQCRKMVTPEIGRSLPNRLPSVCERGANPALEVRVAGGHQAAVELVATCSGLNAFKWRGGAASAT